MSRPRSCNSNPLLDPNIWMLVLLTVIFTSMTALWIHLDQRPTTWDDSWYLLDSLRMFDRLPLDGFRGWLSVFFTAQDRVRPPLMAALPTLVYTAFGRSIKAAMGVNLAFMCVMLFCIYGIVRRYWNPRAAILAVFIAGSMPQIYGLATWYLVEFGLAALAALAIWALVRSEDLTQTRYVVLFSAACGLGLLQKILFPLYVGPLAMYFAFRYLRRLRNLPAEGQVGMPWPVQTLLALCLPVLIIAGPWYSLNFGRAYARAKFSGYDLKEASLYGTGEPFTVSAVYLYLKKIINEGIGPAYFVIALLVLGILTIQWLRRFQRSESPLPIEAVGPSVHPLSYEGKDVQPNQTKTAHPQPSRRLFMALWLVSFVIFVFGRNKDVRFISPLLLAFPVALAVGMEGIASRGKPLMRVLMIGILAFPLFCQIMVLFHPLGSDFTLDIPGGMARDSTTKGLRFVGHQIGAARGYQDDLWPLEQVLDEVSRAAPVKNGQHFFVLNGTDSVHFNTPCLQLIAYRGNLPLSMGTTAYTENRADIDAQLHQSDVYLFRDQGEPDANGYNPYRNRARNVARRGGFQEIISAIKFPDGGVLHIFVNNAHRPGQSAIFIPGDLAQVDGCDVLFGKEIRLTGLSLRQTADTFIIRFRWRCEAPIAREYKCFMHIDDESGKMLSGYDHFPLNSDPPEPAWKVGDSAIEEISFPLSFIPPGKTGHIDVGLYMPQDGSILRVASPLNPSSGWSLMQGDIGVHIDFPLPAPAPTTRP